MEIINRNLVGNHIGVRQNLLGDKKGLDIRHNTAGYLSKSPSLLILRPMLDTLLIKNIGTENGWHQFISITG